MLALRGGGDLVALWAQLASLVELVAGVALAGLGPGLAVYVARTSQLERQRELLREAIKIGLPIALTAAVLAGISAFIVPSEGLAPGVVALAAAIGWMSVIPGLVGNLWLGQQRRGRLLALTAASALLVLAAALIAPPPLVLVSLLAVQAIPALVLGFVGHPAARDGRFRSRSHPLRRYVLPSIAIGILSPGSILLARAIVGESLSWHEAGVLQALWRISDWVAGFAAGVLSVYFLPQLAAAREAGRFGEFVRRAAASVLLPSAIVLSAALVLQRPLLAMLYDEKFGASNAAAALVFGGSLVRIASWIPLYGLYAARATRAIAIGEVFSLPLFALLLFLARDHLTLELVGVLWVASYLAYLVFNTWALRRL